jgi:hypothetical protein
MPFTLPIPNLPKAPRPRPREAILASARPFTAVNLEYHSRSGGGRGVERLRQAAPSLPTIHIEPQALIEGRNWDILI